LNSLAAQVQALKWRLLTNQARRQLVDLHRRLNTPPAQSTSETRLRAWLHDLTRLVSATIDQPLTIQEKLSEEQERMLGKIQMILDLEKPAHTAYALKLTPVVVGKAAPQWMQIEVRSSIGLDTTVG
jgi:hypothetical protein